MTTTDCGAAPPSSLLRRLGPVLLLLVSMAACAHVQIGERNEPPSWRRPGPAVIEPQPRLRVPDDGFRDYLARAGMAAEGV